MQRQKGEYQDLFDDLLQQGFLRARVDGPIVSRNETLQLDRQMRHSINVVVDRLEAGTTGRTRLTEAIESALRLGHGGLSRRLPRATIEGRKQPAAGSGAKPRDADPLFSSQYACTHCGISYEPPTPQLFSFNSPQGMCPQCNGLAVRHDFVPDRLIPDDSLSFAKGPWSSSGPFRNIGRWRRHVFEGVTNSSTRAGSRWRHVLKTPWRNLPDHPRTLLYGTGDRHITYTWRLRAGCEARRTFNGIVRTARKLPQGQKPLATAATRKIHGITMHDCKGTRLNLHAQ